MEVRLGSSFHGILGKLTDAGGSLGKESRHDRKLQRMKDFVSNHHIPTITIVLHI